MWAPIVSSIKNCPAKKFKQRGKRLFITNHLQNLERDLLFMEKVELNNYDGTISFIDIETPNERNDRICSLGIIVTKDQKIVFEKHYLVDPD